MDKKTLIKEMAEVANSLDNKNYVKEADYVTRTMLRVAQQHTIQQRGNQYTTSPQILQSLLEVQNRLGLSDNEIFDLVMKHYGNRAANDYIAFKNSTQSGQVTPGVENTGMMSQVPGGSSNQAYQSATQDYQTIKVILSGMDEIIINPPDDKRILFKNLASKLDEASNVQIEYLTKSQKSDLIRLLSTFSGKVQKFQETLTPGIPDFGAEFGLIGALGRMAVPFKAGTQNEEEIFHVALQRLERNIQAAETLPEPAGFPPTTTAPSTPAPQVATTPPAPTPQQPRLV
jgi:hypothetical protein